VILDVESISTTIVTHAFMNDGSTAVAGGFDHVFLTSKNTTSFAEYQQLSFQQSAKFVLKAIVDWGEEFNQYESVAVTVQSVTIYPPKFIVSRSAVSTHIPLHRLYGKIIYFAALGNHEMLVCWKEQLSKVDIDDLLYAVVDYPLRNLALNAQVRLNMWRRNGLGIANTIENYSAPVLSRYFRDMDLTILQAVVCSILAASSTSLWSPTATTSSSMKNLMKIFTLIIYRFEIHTYLEAAAMSRPTLPENIPEESFQLMGAFLQVILWMFTYLPSAMVDQHSDTLSNEPRHILLQSIMMEKGVLSVVCRDVVHNILSGVTSFQGLNRIKIMVGSANKTVTDQILQSAVQLVCTAASYAASASLTTNSSSAASAAAAPEGATMTTGGTTNTANSSTTTAAATVTASATSLTLEDYAYQVFDPEYMHLSPNKFSAALDRIKDRCKQGSTALFYRYSSTSVANPFKPMIYPLAIPRPHRDFLGIRDILFTKYFSELLYRLLRLSALGKSNRVTILSRVLHLLTFQFHVYDQLMLTFSDGDHPLATYYAQYDQQSPFHAPLVELLGAVYQEQLFANSSSDYYYDQALQYVLFELAIRSPSMKEILASSKINFDISPYLNTTHADATSGKAKTTTAKKAGAGKKGKSSNAQLKALNMMKNAAKAFATETLSDDEDAGGNRDQKALVDSKAGEEDVIVEEPKAKELYYDELYSEEMKSNASTEEVVEEDEAEDDLCILCHASKPGERKGYLSLIQPSTAIQQCISSHSSDATNTESGGDCRGTNCHSWFDECYRIVSVNGCDVYNIPILSIDQPIPSTADQDVAKAELQFQVIDHLTYGTHVLADDRRQHWIHIIAPVYGWMPLYTLYMQSPLHDSLNEKHQKTKSQFLQDSALQHNYTNGVNIKSKYSRSLLTLLVPVQSLMFRKHGGARLQGNTLKLSFLSDLYHVMLSTR
jgi:hypothetical protein